MASTQRRNCLISGANRGIGLEFTRQLLARGEHVIAACRHPGKATALNALAGEHPGRLHVLPLDVADPKSRASLVHDLPLVLGDDRLDLLVNNAGVLHSGERFGHVEAAILEDSFRTNAIGPFLLAQALAPLLKDGARIANLSSVMASIASRGAVVSSLSLSMSGKFINRRIVSGPHPSAWARPLETSSESFESFPVGVFGSRLVGHRCSTYPSSNRRSDHAIRSVFPFGERYTTS